MEASDSMESLRAQSRAGTAGGGIFRASHQEIVNETDLELHSVESLCLFFFSLLFMFSPMAYLFTSGKMDLRIPSRTRL